MGSMRGCCKCLMEPIPAGSRTDPVLAKAEPSRDRGSTSGVTEVRIGEKKTTPKLPHHSWEKGGVRM